MKRAVTLMADGYEILRHVSGHSRGLGLDAIMGKPMTNGKMHRPYLMSREVFLAYRAHDWICRLKPYRRHGWQVWVITKAGREEAVRQPHRGKV